MKTAHSTVSINTRIAVTLLMLTSFRSALCAEPGPLERGHYLVELAGCDHCHTPGHFLGKEDRSRALAGGDVGFEIPGNGTVVGPNLTPDKDTGLGKWSDAQIAAAIRSGMRPDGRVLSPVMPWPNFAQLTNEDVKAIVAYLRALKPVKNKVPGPFAVGQEPTVPVMRLTTAPANAPQARVSQENKFEADR